MDSLLEPLLYSIITMPSTDPSPTGSSLPNRFRNLNPYQQAAIVYLAYGLVYLAGATYLAAVGQTTRGSPILWLTVGGVFVLLFPAFIWRGYKWVTRILSVLLAIRVLGLAKILATGAGARIPLPGGGHIPQKAGAFVFLLVALAACLATARAGWGQGPTWPKTRS